MSDVPVIPTYRELQDKIKTLEGELEYWSGLDSFEDGDGFYVASDSGEYFKVQHLMKGSPQ